MAEGRSPLVIGIDARLRSGEAGGVEQFIIGLAAGLSRLAARDQFLFLCLPGEAGWLAPYVSGPCRIVFSTEERGNASLSSVSLRRRLAATFPWLRAARRRLRRRLDGDHPKPSRLSRTLEDAGAQAIHFPHQSAFVTDLPSIYQPWDLQHVHLPQFFSRDDFESREETYRRACDRADRIVVASEWAKRDLSGQYGLPPDKISVIPVPPPIAAYRDLTDDQAMEIRARLNLPEQFAFYPAQTWRHKNHIRLLEALALVRDRDGIEIPLVCSGRHNEQYPAIARVAANLRLQGQIRFLGYVPQEEVQVLYRSASFLLFPSMFEGWGLPIVEAMISELPVACAKVTSVPELVGDAALLFDPSDVEAIAAAALKMWTDPALRSRLANRGKHRVRDLDWHRTAREFRDLYKEVARGHVSSPG